jgi:hypothetical protein
MPGYKRQHGQAGRDQMRRKVDGSPIRGSRVSRGDIARHAARFRFADEARREMNPSDFGQNVQTYETKMADNILGKVEESQDSLIAERDRLKAELAALKNQQAAPPPEPVVDDNYDRETVLHEMQRKLDAAQSQFDRMEADREREDRVKKVRKPVENVLSAMGFSEMGISQVIRSLGGLSKFGIDPETGAITLGYDGINRPIEEILPVHPLVSAVLREGGVSALKSPEVLRQKEIEALETEKKEIQKNYRGSGTGQLIRIGEINRKLAELRAAAPVAPTKRPSVVDPNLLMERGRIKRLVDQAAERMRQNPSRDDLLIEFSKFKKQLNEIESRIQQQRGG